MRRALQQVGGMLGCAGMIAVVFFVFGIIGSFFASKATITDRLLMGVMAAVPAFLASVLLMANDRVVYNAAMRQVRRRLSMRDDTSSDAFCAALSEYNPTFVLEVRQSLGEFFSIPPAKIAASDDLRVDLNLDALEPSLHTYVTYRVLELRKITPKPFWFATKNLQTVSDLVQEIERVVLELSQ